MSSLSSKLALGAALGAAIAGCQAAGTSAAGHGQAASRSLAAQTSLAKSVASQSPATPAGSDAAAVGVVADCTGPTPLRLTREPSSIILTCADAGIGVQDLNWTSWTASTATGTGLLWENLCDPSCAAGAYGHYPVAVTLSAVKNSAKGTWFSHLAVSWQGSQPGNQTPDNFTLMRPTP